MSSHTASEAGAPALSLQGVGRRFGALEAVKNVTADIPAGERRAVLGPNGAGKTTLFNLIAGDYFATSGTVRLFGEDVTNTPPHKRSRMGLARTYQTSLLFGGLSVADNLYLASLGGDNGRFGLVRPDADDRHRRKAVETAGGLGMTDVIDVIVGDLSHGQQRQLELGMALASEPRLVLLDEPAAGLSASERQDLLGTLDRLPRDITIVLIEHDMDVALQAVDVVTVMNNGEVLAEGTPEEIQRDQQVLDIYLGHGRE